MSALNNTDSNSRRNFLKDAFKFTIGFGALSSIPIYLGINANRELFFQISLSEHSLQRALATGAFSHLEFPEKARNLFEIETVEYGSCFFKTTEQKYLHELRQRANDAGVSSLHIKITQEGNLSNTQENKRLQAAENHLKWLETASFLNCQSIRVDLLKDNQEKKSTEKATKSLTFLSENAAQHGLNILVENHGDTENGKWISQILQIVDQPNCSLLPDLGDFWKEKIDLNYYRPEQIKAVSTRSSDLAIKPENNLEYLKKLQFLKEKGFNGYIGIEYEGKQLNEEEGIRATKELLVKAGRSLA